MALYPPPPPLEMLNNNQYHYNPQFFRMCNVMVYFNMGTKPKSYMFTWNIEEHILQQGGDAVKNALRLMCSKQVPPVRLEAFRLGWKKNPKDASVAVDYNFYTNPEVEVFEQGFILELTLVLPKRAYLDIDDQTVDQSSEGENGDYSPPKKKRRIDNKKKTGNNRASAYENKNKVMEVARATLQESIPMDIQSSMSEADWTKYSYLNAFNPEKWTEEKK